MRSEPSARSLPTSTFPSMCCGSGKRASHKKKPMKRSGARRYYRPDDVDLLKGIRRLLYGEGYTIRGVQRILKEHGVKAVQGLSDSSVAASFGAVEKTLELSMAEEDAEAPASFEGEDDDYEGGEDGIDFRFLEL